MPAPQWGLNTGSERYTIMISFKHPSLMNPWNRLRLIVAAWMPLGPSARFNNVLREAASLAEADQDEANLPFWVADAVIEPENDLQELKVARSRFMRRYLNSPDRLAKWEAMVGRAKVLTSESDHVLEHFLSVSGHSLEDIVQNGDGSPARNTHPGRSISGTNASDLLGYGIRVAGLEDAGAALAYTEIKSGAYSGVRRRGSTFSCTSRVLRDAAFGDVRVKKMRRAGSRAAVSAVSVYLILIMMGSWEPAVDAVGITSRVPEYSWLELGSTPRGRITPTDYYVTQRYKEAVRKLRKVNTSVLGYLPGYRKDLLNDGITEMQRAIAFQRTSGYVYPEALLLLADAYLKAGQPEKAIPLVNQVIERNEHQATEARHLRSKLRRQGLYPSLGRTGTEGP